MPAPQPSARRTGTEYRYSSARRSQVNPHPAFSNDNACPGKNPGQAHIKSVISLGKINQAYYAGPLSGPLVALIVHELEGHIIHLVPLVHDSQFT